MPPRLKMYAKTLFNELYKRKIGWIVRNFVTSQIRSSKLSTTLHEFK